MLLTEWREASPRKRAIICLVSVLGTMAGFLALVARVNFDNRALVFLVFPVGWSVALMRVRCPRCRTPVIKQKVRLFGEEWWYWGGFRIARYCAKCGHDLSHTL